MNAMQEVALNVTVPHIVKGRLVEGSDASYALSDGTTFSTPALDLNAIVHSRDELLPCYNVPVGEIIDFLVATGERLSPDSNPILARAIDATAAVNPLPRAIVDNIYRGMSYFFSRESLEFELERTLGGPKAVDGWTDVVDPKGRNVQIRAHPARLVQILAGNSPSVAASSITRTALSKGVSVLKLPSNDLFTASAILRTMAEIDPSHPVLRSFSAVYWRGGDNTVENTLYRPQYFNKIVVWGGEGAVRNVVKYLGPGMEMIAFDPTVSISLIGREIHASEASVSEAANLAAEDVMLLNQEACAASRFQFVEGEAEQIDRYCRMLVEQLNVDRNTGSAQGSPPPQDVQDELEALRDFGPEYRIWGKADGTGLVICSADPVSFHPIGKVVNVIPVSDLTEALPFASPATQTVGVWPANRKVGIRDRLYAAGVQRVVSLGTAGQMLPGLPHDGFLPLHRFVTWVTDEG